MGLNISKKLSVSYIQSLVLRVLVVFLVISQMSQKFILLFTYFDPEPLA